MYLQNTKQIGNIKGKQRINIGNRNGHNNDQWKKTKKKDKKKHIERNVRKKM